MKDKPEKPSKNALRITQQYRESTGMMYEFAYEGTKLLVRLFESRSEAHWRVEARTSDAPEAMVVRGEGSTGESALRAAAEAWSAQPELPPFDWEAVAGALRTVRAI